MRPVTETVTLHLCTSTSASDDVSGLGYTQFATVARQWVPDVGDLIIHTGEFAFKDHSHWEVHKVDMRGNAAFYVFVHPVQPEPGVRTYRLMNYSGRGQLALGEIRRFLPPPVGAYLPGPGLGHWRRFSWDWTPHVLDRKRPTVLAGEQPRLPKALWWEIKAYRWFGEPWPVQINLTAVRPNDIKKREPVAEPYWEDDLRDWLS